MVARCAAAIRRGKDWCGRFPTCDLMTIDCPCLSPTAPGLHQGRRRVGNKDDGSDCRPGEELFGCARERTKERMWQTGNGQVTAWTGRKVLTGMVARGAGAIRRGRRWCGRWARPRCDLRHRYAGDVWRAGAFQREDEPKSDGEKGTWEHGNTQSRALNMRAGRGVRSGGVGWRACSGGAQR